MSCVYDLMSMIKVVYRDTQYYSSNLCLNILYDPRYIDR